MVMMQNGNALHHNETDLIVALGDSDHFSDLIKMSVVCHPMHADHVSETSYQYPKPKAPNQITCTISHLIVSTKIDLLTETNSIYNINLNISFPFFLLLFLIFIFSSFHNTKLGDPFRSICTSMILI